MKHSFFLLLIVFLPVSVQADNYLSRIDKRIIQELPRWEIPGLAVSIVCDGTTVFSKGYGVCKLGEPQSVDENTVFAIASNSKTFTCAALGMLADEGKLNWDDKVIQHLPEFQLNDKQRTKDLTLRDLLAHRTGMETANRLWWFSQFPRYDLLHRMRLLQPVSPVRYSYGYNNLMYLAAGLVLEKAADTSWDAFIQKRILDPLLMKNSSTSINHLEGKTNIAQPHACDRSGRMTPSFWYNSDHMAPAASINSTADDMAQWMKFLLSKGKINGKTLLSEKQIDEMQSPQSILSPSSFQKKGRDVHFYAYGFGHRLYQYRNEKFVEHSGHLITFRSFVCLIPEKNFGVTVLASSYSSFPTGLAYQIADAFLGYSDKDWIEVYWNDYQGDRKTEQKAAKELDGKRKPNTKPSLPLKSYAGVYENPLFGQFIVTLGNNGLQYNHNNTPLFKGKLEHWFDDSFAMIPHLIFRDRNLIVFHKNKKNQIHKVKIDGYYYLRIKK